jgi:uncharacterized membrane protein YfcA
LDPWTVAILAGFVFLSFSVQALAGFGGSVIAVTLGAHFVPIDRLVPLVVASGLTQTAWLLSRHWRHVDVRLLLRSILPLMILGAALAQALRTVLEGPRLELLYGLFVVAVSARGLLAARRAPDDPLPPLSKPAACVGTFGAGIIQGIYASGGPLLVYVVGRAGLNKATFRATLVSVWLLMNTGLLVTFVFQGRLTWAEAPTVAWLLPSAACALLVGEWGHDRVDEARFRRVVNALLLFAGGALLVPAFQRVVS